MSPPPPPLEPTILFNIGKNDPALQHRLNPTPNVSAFAFALSSRQLMRRPWNGPTNERFLLHSPASLYIVATGIDPESRKRRRSGRGGGVVVRDFSWGKRGGEGRGEETPPPGCRAASARCLRDGSTPPPSPIPCRRRESAHARQGPRLHPVLPLTASGSLATCTRRSSPRRRHKTTLPSQGFSSRFIIKWPS